MTESVIKKPPTNENTSQDKPKNDSQVPPPSQAPPPSKAPSRKPSEKIITRKQVTLYKGGIRDRPIGSWIRILIVVGLWWLFVFGFTALCFFLMDLILYGSNDEIPYFVRNPGKYPNILSQPGLNITCLETSCNVTINKMFLWTPEPYDLSKDSPSVKLEDGTEFKLKLVASDLNFKGIYVTCYGETEKGRKNLEGLKLDKPGYAKDAFPWTEKGGQNKEERTVIVDLADTNAIKGKDPVTLMCQAWARNINTEAVFVDSGRPNGGGALLICFGGGKVKNCDEEQEEEEIDVDDEEED